MLQNQWRQFLNSRVSRRFKEGEKFYVQIQKQVGPRIIAGVQNKCNEWFIYRRVFWGFAVPTLVVFLKMIVRKR